MVESLNIGPGGEFLFSKGHEPFLKAGRKPVPAFGIPGRNDAALARIVAEKRDLTDPERLEFVWRTVKTILPEWLGAAEFKVAAESATSAFIRQFRKPANDFLKALAAHDRRAGGCAVVGKAAGGFAHKLNCKSKKIAQPPVDCGGLSEDEILAIGFALDPEGRLTIVVRERGTNQMHTVRALAIYVGSGRIENGKNTVMLENSARIDASRGDGNAI